MPVIKPRTRGRAFVPLHTRLEQQNHDTLVAYAAFIDEDIHYVLNEVIDRVLAKDKDYVHWRATHPQAVAVPPGIPTRESRARTRAAKPTARVLDLGAGRE